MSTQRNLLKRPRKIWGSCKATLCAPNAATHKTGYCDFHHSEYEQAKKRYNDMKYNYNKGRTTKNPPDWNSYLATVPFTPIHMTNGSLDERVISIIKGVLNETKRATDMATRLNEPPHELLATLRRIDSTLKILIDNDHVDQPDRHV